MKKFILTIFITSFHSLLFAQVKPAIDYAKADSLAVTIKYDHDVYALATALTKPFAEPELKARAIFKWITENIGYDVKFYNKYYYQGKEPKSYTCRGDSMGCEIKRNVWETAYINKVLDNKKAVCQGYSLLFKKMCNIAGIESEIVPGYVRTQFYEIGTPGNDDHAWNTVRLNTVDYLVDATWAAGGCSEEDDGKLLEFHKHFNNYYWLTPADDFARNHFPEEAKWTLLPHYTKENFSHNPYYSGDVIPDIKLMKPDSGIINVKRGDTIRFKFKYTGQLHNMQINSSSFQNPEIMYWDYVSKRKRIQRLDTFAVKQQQYVKFKRNGDDYGFYYVVTDNSLYYLDILFDYRRVMRFTVVDR